MGDILKKDKKNKIIFRRNLDYSNLYLGTRLMNLIGNFKFLEKLDFYILFE